MKKTGILLVAAALIFAISSVGSAQVLGPCGASNAPKMEKKMPAMPHMGKMMAQPMQQHVLLPGDQAINFSLPAVVGNTIKTIKLSDYAGKWRVVCFYPGDFTFV
ncbi:MAG: redoxin domain-containing protein [Calditrichaeota bacterium]|nr:redoxin domain-containing protein [Calditrichota bacterium]